MYQDTRRRVLAALVKCQSFAVREQAWASTEQVRAGTRHRAETLASRTVRRHLREAHRDGLVERRQDTGSVKSVRWRLPTQAAPR